MPNKTVNGQTVEMTQEEYDLLLAQLAEANSPAKVEEEIQRITDNLLQNSERDVAIALATIDLVIALRDGQLDGLTRPQIRSAFRDRVIQTLRERRGLV
jgi:hypothetical protein